MTAKKPIQDLSFEQALSELEEIVKALESGQAPLEESIGAFERGVLLKKHCENKLKEARAKIETISIAGDGSVKTSPFEEEK